MDVCSWDWELASKFIPLINGLATIGVAVFVYHFWHKQKGKEVVANEAKNTILAIIEVEKLNNSITNYIAYKNTEENKKKIKEMINEFQYKTDSLHEKFDFLNEIIKDNEDIKLILDRYLSQSTLSIVRYNALLDCNNSQDSIKSVSLSLQQIYINMGSAIKIKLMDYALFKS